MENCHSNVINKYPCQSIESMDLLCDIFRIICTVRIIMRQYYTNCAMDFMRRSRLLFKKCFKVVQRLL